ncbi:MAG: M20/M25/M40 family metallo-hydrolase, partial [Phycisphaerae bacterium]
MSDSDAFSGLEPSGLWRHFEAMTRIARPSGHEAAMADYVAAWAADRRFEVLRDAVGNVCVRVPGRPPLENAPPVVLQSHMDMVCERDSDSPFDASVGRMRVLREGDWLRADGTTLGADNGIGCAAMMAVAESPDCPHGPLELLFTVDEERGLVGAKNLDPAMLRGRVLLNLDSEDEGLLVVGCAGGRGSTLTFAASRESAPTGWTAGQVCIAGLRGGHSGLEIDKGRLNANKAAARVLLSARQTVRLRLAGLHAGDKTNA